MLIVDACQLNAQFHLTCTLISNSMISISFNFNLINAIFYLLAANNTQVTSTSYPQEIVKILLNFLKFIVI